MVDWASYASTHSAKLACTSCCYWPGPLEFKSIGVALCQLRRVCWQNVAARGQLCRAFTFISRRVVAAPTASIVYATGQRGAGDDRCGRQGQIRLVSLLSSWSPPSLKVFGNILHQPVRAAGAGDHVVGRFRESPVGQAAGLCRALFHEVQKVFLTHGKVQLTSRRPRRR